MKVYKTNFDDFIKSIFTDFSKSFLGPWRSRSLGLLSILIGFYLASTIAAFYLQKYNQRIIVVVVLCIFLELGIRYRNDLMKRKKNSLLHVIDNLRIGITYAIVLEAFKLGS